jgi:hypothetical protein
MCKKRKYKDKIADYKKAADDYGLLIAEVGAWCNLFDKDEKKAEENLTFVMKTMEMADEIGAKCVVNIAGSSSDVWDGGSRENYSQKTFEKVVAQIQKIISVSERCPYTLEPMPWMLPYDAESYLKLIEAVGDERFKVHMDAVNLICSPEKYFFQKEFLDDLFQKGVVGVDGVKEFLKEKNDELKLFGKIQELCGSIRKNATNLSLIRTWRDWNFKDEMILEAAKRSATSANPLPYINKILSDWKRQEIFDIKAIPESDQNGKTSAASRFVSQAVADANAKSDRERYYALLREKAQIRADKFVAKANENTRFKEVSSALSKMEFTLAKAEVFTPEQLPKLQAEKQRLLAEHKAILLDLGIDESDLTPKYTCKKCSDTGYLPSGAACACYKKA